MDLKKERESLVAQRDNAFAVYQQAIGAITLLDALLAEQEDAPKDALSQEDLETMLGGKIYEEPPAES